MCICFVEYHIEVQFVASYLKWIGEKLAAENGVKLYEGTDQLNLFVEVWEAADEEAARAIKEERCSQRSSWHRMAEWVPGGAPKIHAWTFKPVPVQV